MVLPSTPKPTPFFPSGSVSLVSPAPAFGESQRRLGWLSISPSPYPLYSRGLYLYFYLSSALSSVVGYRDDQVMVPKTRSSQCDGGPPHKLHPIAIFFKPVLPLPFGLWKTNHSKFLIKRLDAAYISHPYALGSSTNMLKKMCVDLIEWL